MALVEAYAGEIRIFAGNYAPRGWALCEGQLLPVDQNPVLFALLGNTYGGDGHTTFSLPDLRGYAPVGSTQNKPAGQPVDSQDSNGSNDTGPTPALPLNYIICLQGVFPDRA
jgi:microcystin-dependent protein